MLGTKRRNSVGRTLIEVATIILAFGVVDVSADRTIYGIGLHPVLQWACGFRNNVVDATRSLEQGSLEPPRLFGLPYFSQFRGGEQNDTILLSEETLTDAASIAIAPVKALIPDDLDYSTSPYVFSLYQKDDGSQDDPDGIPTRYLKMQGFKRDLAKNALEATIAWRRSNNIDTILARPHPKFDICKRVFPHYFCGRDDTNHVILLQRPGLIDLSIAEANDLSGDDLLYHYIYEMEYLWQILEPVANGTMTSIIDLTGLNLSILSKRELLNVVQKFCSTMDAHFPQRSHKTLLINSPKWFGAVYKLISPLLRETTKQKIIILSKGSNQDQALRDLLKECPIEKTDGKLEDVPPSQMETDLREFVSRRSGHNRSMYMLSHAITFLEYASALLGCRRQEL